MKIQLQREVQTRLHQLQGEMQLLKRFSNHITFDLTSGHVPSVILVLLQVHGSSEERGAAA